MNLGNYNELKIKEGREVTILTDSAVITIKVGEDD